VLQFVVVLAILAAVVLVVSAPIRRARMAQWVGGDPESDVGASSADEAEAVESSEVAELEAARDAKYREIRDADLDHRTGKLSDADFEAVDRGLRAEAVELLHRLDRARGVEGDDGASEPAAGGGVEGDDGASERAAGGGGEARPRGSSRI